MPNHVNGTAEHVPQDKTPRATKTWAIRDVPVAVAELANDCAGRRLENVGIWLERAVQAQARMESRDRFFLPPVTKAGPSHDNVTSAGSIILGLTNCAETLQQALTIISLAEAGALPKRIRAQALSYVYEQLKVARGLPASASRPGSSLAISGATGSHSVEHGAESTMQVAKTAQGGVAR